jgi:hypothetical protein
MINWAVVTALFAVVLPGVLIGWTLWRKHRARMCEEDRQWRDAQAAQLKSVKERLKAQMAPEPDVYPELPKVRLAGLLAPPRQAPFEWR